MKQVIVTYKVKIAQAEENEMLIKEVFKQLHEQQLAGVQYTAYKLGDGVSFMHIGSFENENANNKFAGLPAFKNFRAGIKDRCEEQPVTRQFEEVGSYANASQPAFSE